jgi:hypothetical protein
MVGMARVGHVDLVTSRWPSGDEDRSTTTTFDFPKLVAAEVRDMADLLESLDEAQLDTPSLCEGWRVRDVAGHVASGTCMSLPAVMMQTAKHGFSVPKASKAGAILCDGPVVRGAAEAILLALTGRPAGRAELTGDGLPTLAAR